MVASCGDFLHIWVVEKWICTRKLQRTSFQNKPFLIPYLASVEMNFQNELNGFLKALKGTSFPRITSKKVTLEMIANGVAALCAMLVYSVLQKFIVVKSIRNLWGIAAKKDKMLVSKDTFEWISGVMIFVIAIFVFTYVEELVEKYLAEREKQEK